MDRVPSPVVASRQGRTAVAGIDDFEIVPAGRHIGILHVQAEQPVVHFGEFATSVHDKGSRQWLLPQTDHRCAFSVQCRRLFFKSILDRKSRKVLKSPLHAVHQSVFEIAHE